MPLKFSDFMKNQHDNIITTKCYFDRGICIIKLSFFFLSLQNALVTSLKNDRDSWKNDQLKSCLLVFIPYTKKCVENLTVNFLWAETFFIIFRVKFFSFITFLHIKFQTKVNRCFAVKLKNLLIMSVAQLGSSFFSFYTILHIKFWIWVNPVFLTLFLKWLDPNWEFK